MVEQLSTYFISGVFFEGETWEKRGRWQGWLDIGAVVCAEGFGDLARELQGFGSQDYSSKSHLSHKFFFIFNSVWIRDGNEWHLKQESLRCDVMTVKHRCSAKAI